LPLVSGGNARCIAVTSTERLKDLPDVATTGQQGLAAVNTQFWIGFSGPPGLPEHVMKSWAEGVSEVLKSPDVIAKLARITSAATFLGPEEFKRFISEESRMVKELMGER
jgi:tripartite-type tricarboxylate transporter receptor subunit TctC